MTTTFEVKNVKSEIRFRDLISWLDEKGFNYTLSEYELGVMISKKNFGLIARVKKVKDLTKLNIDYCFKVYLVIQFPEGNEGFNCSGLDYDRTGKEFYNNKDLCDYIERFVDYFKKINF